MSTPTTGTFDVQFRFHGEAVGAMRNEVRVVAEIPASGGTYDIATDEGEFHGGDGTAPTPLHLFTAALVGCFMTQTRAFSRALGVQIDSLAVEGSTQWLGHLRGRLPYVAEPIEFCLDVHLESPNDTEQVLALVEAAKQGCFVEQTLASSHPVRHRLRHGHRDIDVEQNETWKAPARRSDGSGV